MELRQLRYFVAAARALNFSEASAKVNITQSTLSQQIRQLEDELGTQLFYRNSHSVKLTEEGERLLPLAIDTLNSAESCADAVKNIHGLVTGTLNIGVTYSFSPILTETMLEFMQRYPGIKLNVYYKTMAELLVMLSNYEVDFVLAFMPDNLRQEIESHILFATAQSGYRRSAAICYRASVTGASGAQRLRQAARGIRRHAAHKGGTQ